METLSRTGTGTARTLTSSRVDSDLSTDSSELMDDSSPDISPPASPAAHTASNLSAAAISQLERDFNQGTAGAGHTKLAQSAVPSTSSSCSIIIPVASRGSCLHCSEPVLVNQERAKISDGYLHQRCVSLYNQPAEPTDDQFSMEVVGELRAASGKWAEIGWRKSPNFADKLAGKHGAKRGIVYDGKLVENDGLHWLKVSMPDGVSPVALPEDDIDNSSYICTRRPTVCDTRHYKFLYVPLSTEGIQLLRPTRPVYTFQLLKPTPWCRSPNMTDTMQINAEAGESWQGNFILVADVAFLAVEMATEPPSRRQYLPLGLKEAKPNVRQVHPAGVVVSSRCDSTWVPTNLTVPPPPASPSAPG